MVVGHTEDHTRDYGATRNGPRGRALCPGCSGSFFRIHGAGPIIRFTDEEIEARNHTKTFGQEEIGWGFCGSDCFLFLMGEGILCDDRLGPIAMLSELPFPAF